MAEFRQLNDTVDKLQRTFELLQERQSSSNLIENEEQADEEAKELAFLQESVEEEGETRRKIAKYRERLNYVDPVTQKPRFGPKMQTKVEEVLSQYDNVLSAYESSSITDQIRDRISAFRAAKSDKLEQEKQNEEQRLHAARVKAQEEKERKEEEELRVLEQQEKKEKEEREELARLANESREQRRLEREKKEKEEEDKREERRARNREAVRNAGPETLKQAIAYLQKTVESRAQVKTTVTSVQRILENIVASPENLIYRQIPLANENFHQDVGQFDGGLKCLRAMGFQEKGPEGQVFLVLEEPDLMQDMDKWSNWFDNLKAMRDLLETTVAELE